MNQISDIYPKLLALSLDDLVKAMRVFPSRDSDDETMTWARRHEWECTARELSHIGRTIVLEARGVDLIDLKEARETYERLKKDLNTACKKALHCGTSLHSGTEPKDVFPIDPTWAANGNIVKDRWDKFHAHFERAYGSLFSAPEWIDLDFDVLTEIPQHVRKRWAEVLGPLADTVKYQTGAIEKLPPVTEVPETLRELFP